MSGTVTVYTFEDADGQSADDYSTQDYQEAHAYAQKNQYMLIGNEYEWSDSELVEDFTPTKKGWFIYEKGGPYEMCEDCTRGIAEANGRYRMQHPKNSDRHAVYCVACGRDRQDWADD